MTEPTANPLDMLLQQGRNAVNGKPQFTFMKAPGMLWGICLITAVNGASFIGTASAATPDHSKHTQEVKESLKQAAYKAAHAQLQAAENYCLRDKIAFLVKQGFGQAPTEAEAQKTPLQKAQEHVLKMKEAEAEASNSYDAGEVGRNFYTEAIERRVQAQEAVEHEEWKLEQQNYSTEEAAEVDTVAGEGVAHLSARAAEELKAEVLAEDSLKQKEV